MPATTFLRRRNYAGDTCKNEEFPAATFGKKVCIFRYLGVAKNNRKPEVAHLPVPVLMQHSKTYIFHVDGKVGSFSLLQGLLLTSLIITLLPLPFPYYLSKTKNQPLPCLFLKKGVSSSATCSKYLYYSATSIPKYSLKSGSLSSHAPRSSA